MTDYEGIENTEETDEPDKERMQLIRSLASTLLSKRNEAVEARAASGVESRWSQDENTFNGVDKSSQDRMIDYATGEATLKSSSGPKRSQVVVNVIRGKCEVAEGRFSDILLPVDDRNWGLKVTPAPELSEAMKDTRQAAKDNQPLQRPDGQPMQIKDVATSDMDVAKDKMSGMETAIDDQLTECGYNGECRKVVANAVRLGTGILKGPNVVKTIKRSWKPETDGETTVHVAEIIEDFKPASKSVDPWNIYPDPDCEEDISRAAYMWERDEILPRELRKLIGVDGYLEDQILMILSEEPKRTTVNIAQNKKQQIKQTIASAGSTYERWEYYGDLDKESLESLGCDCSEANAESLSACVVFVNDRPIKVLLNTLDSGELPYDFFQWTTVNGSPWGIGIPRIALWQQRCLIAAWRAMMDNAGDSAGANIVLGSGVEPDDGRWEITGKKIWRATGESEDVRQAFAQFQIANNQVELQNIIELALRFIDMETSLPMMFQGEKGEIPETLGATNIMVDANNVALRSRVKTWDDRITRPHITRYYSWNMQYNEDPEIKGDYNVDVRGTSVLLEKDQQAKSLFQVFQAKQDPDIKALVDWKKAIKALFSAMHLDILKSDDEIKADEEKQTEQPKDPRIAAAEIRAQTEMEKAEMSQKGQNEEFKLRRDATISELQEKAKDAEAERQHEKEIKGIDYQIKIMEFSSKSGISLDKIKADLATNSAKMNLQRDLSSQKGGGEQIIEPVSEPAGKAKDGRAFED